MPIRWISETDARKFLAGGTEGRLATRDSAGQPYITGCTYSGRGSSGDSDCS
jgi:nitroimidazol reductase NimA-like FMN-containing flavoprotein (pyridoxamine 5'-phosphate oxidase superfamily)